jgi:hypothetical protein
VTRSSSSATTCPVELSSTGTAFAHSGQYVHKWEFEPKDLGYEMTVEEWVLPDRSDLVEISITVDPNKAVEANERFVDFLRSRGFDTEGEQQTKTRTALEFFTGKSLD